MPSETPCCITGFRSNVAYQLLKRNSVFKISVLAKNKICPATEYQINVKDRYLLPACTFTMFLPLVAYEFG